ncbi:MAG: hypothetical protein M1834_006426 [Cirrosporium novae-zelandiae]|nr:MAG: hypothetical protein M1834_006426 [Cirrosporium novae-zelandiae]
MSTHTAARTAIRYLSPKPLKHPPNPNPNQAHLLLSCSIKPNVSAQREGIESVTEEAIGICVAAVPRGGRSNEGVRGVLGKALGLPKGDIIIVKGATSRQKIISVPCSSSADGLGLEQISRVLERLRSAIKK